MTISGVAILWLIKAKFSLKINVFALVAICLAGFSKPAILLNKKHLLKGKFMKLHTRFGLGLVASVFAMGVAIAASHEGKMHDHKHAMDNMDSDAMGMGMMQDQMMMDPVARAQKHLSALQAKLKLSQAQQPAWQTFSDQVNAQARNMASKQDKMKGAMANMPMTTPERMAMMAGMMKDRAQAMATMADAVKPFYASLTPEQKTTFDSMHMQQMKSMKH
ncbi:MAG: Spy/CpxP family protein refolding chaperone [Sulfuriferula sp.]